MKINSKYVLSDVDCGFIYHNPLNEKKVGSSKYILSNLPKENVDIIKASGSKSLSRILL
jgi:hypothetical protein